MMEMISTRLTKSQKAEILEAYRSGDSTNSLADKYSCTTNTIIRTVKMLLSDIEYKLLKGKSLKSNNKNLDAVNLKDSESNKESVSYWTRA